MNASPTALEVFEARAAARAHLYSIGEHGLHAAVDELQLSAVRYGLVAEIGQDAVQAIMAEAFRAVRREIEEAPPPRDQPPARRGVPQSTLHAADYVRRRGDPDALRQWLGEHRDYLPGILEHWRHGC
jgi:hypothetical protein